MRCTADLKVDKFGEGAVNTDIAKAIFDHFAGQNIKVLSIQQCRNKIARVTFEDQTACECVQLRGELSHRLPLPQIGLMSLCIITPMMLQTPILMMHWIIMVRFTAFAISIGPTFLTFRWPLVMCVLTSGVAFRVL